MRIALVAYGLALSLFAVLHFNSATPHGIPVVGIERQRDIPNSIAVLNQGGPPLLDSNGNSLPGIDDPGIYLYLPLLGHAFGVTEPDVLLKWSLIGLFVLALALYGLIFYELFGSLAAGAIAPALLLLHEYRFYERTTEIYWVAAWCLYFCLPILLLLYKLPWTRWSVVTLAALDVVGSFATSIRYPAGLPILLATLLLILLRQPGWGRRACIAGVAIVGYLSIYNFAFSAIAHARDEYTGARARPYKISPTWHLTYIGLGYIENRFRIRNQDQIAYRDAKRANPHLAYFGPGYEKAVRRQYFHVLRADPGFVLKSYALKIGAVLRDGLARHWIAAFLLVIMLVAGRARERQLLLLVVPALFFAFLPPVLTLPIPKYEEPWRAAWVFLEIFALGWLVSTARRDLVDPALRNVGAPLRGLDLTGWLRDRRARARQLGQILRAPLVWALALVGGLLLILTAGPLSRAVARARAEAPYLQSDSGTRSARSLRGTPERSWSFASGLPAGWRPVNADARIRVANGAVRVRTSTLRDNQELASPDIQLKAANYTVSVDASVVHGGMMVGALNVADNTWLTTIQHFRDRYAPPDSPKRRLAASFSLYKPTTVRIVLVNHVGTDESSTWSVRGTEILSDPVPLLSRPLAKARSKVGESLYRAQSVAFYRPKASALEHATDQAGPVRQAWSFAQPQMLDWLAGKRTAVRGVAGGVLVGSSPDVGQHTSELQSPTFRLPAGTYRVAVSGRVLDGGLRLSAIDVNRRAALATSFFWSGQKFSNATMATIFELARPALVRVGLANWVSTAHPSTWLVREARVKEVRSSATYEKAVLADAPVGYWPLVNAVGRVPDLAGPNPGRHERGRARRTDGPLPGGDRAIRFDGLGGGVSVPYNRALNPVAFSVEAWFKFASLGRPVMPLASERSSPTTGTIGWYWFHGGPTSALAFTIATRARTIQLVGSIPVAPGAWHQYVATYDGTTVRVYVDGALNAQVSGVSFAPNRELPLTIGHGLEDGRPLYFMDGAVAQVALYRAALSPARVSAHYRAGAGLY